MQATVERSQEQPWVQVIGKIAVHLPGREPHLLKGATRTLLAILVAAGPLGTALEEIAQAYWRKDRPQSWRIALRVSASHLSTQLPDGWEVCTDENLCRLEPAAGFVDAWRLKAEHGATDCAAAPPWLANGRPFDDITGVELVNRAARQITDLMPSGTANPRPDDPPTDDHGAEDDGHGVLRARLGSSRRLILSAPPEKHALIAHLAVDDDTTQHHLVVGDRGLLLPLGPFTLTFPELRNQVWLEREAVDAGSVEQAFSIVADVLAQKSLLRPQRMIITNAHELDAQSLMVTLLLIDRAPQNNFSLIMVADLDDHDPGWLDFVGRSVTAGCVQIELPV